MKPMRNFADACGGLIEAVNGTITSPSFPELYPANKNCIWEVLAPPQWKITVNFTHFDIEGNNVSGILITTVNTLFFRDILAHIPYTASTRKKVTKLAKEKKKNCGVDFPFLKPNT